MWSRHVRQGCGSGLKQVTGRKAAVNGDSDSFPSLQPSQVLSHCEVSIAPVPHHHHQSQATNPTSGTGVRWGGRGKTWLGQTDDKAMDFSELQLLQVSLGAEQSIWFNLSLNALLQFERVLFAKPQN